MRKRKINKRNNVKKYQDLYLSLKNLKKMQKKELKKDVDKQ